MERARDLFEQCLEGCPSEHCKVRHDPVRIFKKILLCLKGHDFFHSQAIYLLYAKLEEQHGMARHAMSVYERAAEAVPKQEKFYIYNVYLKKAAEIYGVTRTRQIYEKVSWRASGRRKGVFFCVCLLRQMRSLAGGGGRDTG